MLKLVFLVCLATGPETCEQREIVIHEPEVTPMACLMGAPPTLAQWRATHPGWRIARWHCEGGEQARLDH
ncbi:MAG: hypothetical protein ACFBWO_13135 [Paracoccaceae bacterium]